MKSLPMFIIKETYKIILIMQEPLLNLISMKSIEYTGLYWICRNELIPTSN